MDTLGFATGVTTAFALGAVIGAERELRQHHEAGLRTNSLVAGGAALFVSVAQLVGQEASPTRVAGQVVSGIGFLAGGVILRDGLAISGLTTAATLWCAAAIGVLAGSGFLAPAVLGTLAVLSLHVFMRPVKMSVERWLRGKSPARAGAATGYHLRVVCGIGHEPAVRARLMEAASAHAGLAVRGLHGEPGSRPGERIVTAEFQSPDAADAAVEGVAAALLAADGVLSAGWARARKH